MRSRWHPLHRKSDVLIINCCCYPEHLGSEFITVYQDIVRERVNAKKSGDKAKAQALKIPINATFGKFSDRYSRFYSPFLSPKITVTGQLSLLMLIEKLEENGIKVISANTDGIVTYFHKDKSELLSQRQIRTQEKNCGCLVQSYQI